MGREIDDDEALERGRRGNEHALHTHGINCAIGLIYCAAIIIGISLLAGLVFVLCSGYEYFIYLSEDANKAKLFELLEWIASHSIGVVFGATPFIVLWLKSK